MQGEADFVRVGCTPGENALELNGIVADGANFQQLGLDGLRVSHVNFSMAHAANGKPSNHTAGGPRGSRRPLARSGPPVETVYRRRFRIRTCHSEASLCGCLSVLRRQRQSVVPRCSSKSGYCFTVRDIVPDEALRRLRLTSGSVKGHSPRRFRREANGASI